MNKQMKVYIPDELHHRVKQLSFFYILKGNKDMSMSNIVNKSIEYYLNIVEKNVDFDDLEE